MSGPAGTRRVCKTRVGLAPGRRRALSELVQLVNSVSRPGGSLSTVELLVLRISVGYQFDQDLAIGVYHRNLQVTEQESLRYK